MEKYSNFPHKCDDLSSNFALCLNISAPNSSINSKYYSLLMKLFSSIFNNREEIILRDYLALERTRLANERTLLAYSRTSLYMLLGGIAFLQLEEFRRIQWVGYLALALSVILIFIGVFRYFQIKRRLSRYYEWDKAENGSRENKDADTPI
jgi:putative membrane protein